MKQNCTTDPASLCFRKPRTVLAIWIAASLLLFSLGLGLGIHTILPGPSSEQALLENPGEREAIAAGIPPRDQLFLLLDGGSSRYDSPAFLEARDSLWALLLHARGTEELFFNLQTAGRTEADDDKFISSDGTKILFLAQTAARIDQAASALKNLPADLRNWQNQHPGFTLHWLSRGLGDDEIFELINSDLDHSLIYTLPLSLAVLLWTFGSVAGGLIPLFTALISLVASIGFTALLSRIFGPVSATAVQLVVLLVLAIGVDYSLFILSRVREEVAAGKSYALAIQSARATAGSAVIVSGLTVALSLCGLLLMRDSVLTSMAAVSVTAVAITVAGCIAALPALLQILGPRIDFGSIARFGPGPRRRPILEMSIKRPVPVLVSGTALMAWLSFYAVELRLGSTVQATTLPPSMQLVQARKALDIAFPETSGTDMSLILTGKDLPKLEQNGTIEKMIERFSELPAVRGPMQTEVSEDGSVERYNFSISGNLNSNAARDAVLALRSTIIPVALAGSQTSGYLGGTVPFAVDDLERYGDRAWRVYAAVLAVSMVFLLVAFKSLVVPIKAILLNLLSTGASFGALVLIFQGAGGSWFPSSLNYGVVESFVPPLLFSILFGLSMDYHVFLLSRVKEEVDRGATTAVAVQTAIATTSRTITGAAMIMVAVFVVIGSLELPVMKQLGIGLAIAVLLDATIVRSFLLPSSLVLLGRWNWYLPKLRK